MLKKHSNKMASSGPPYRYGQGLTPAEIDESIPEETSFGGRFRDIPTYSELYGDPRLVEELPDTAARKVSENLEAPFLANLLQVSKRANSAFLPAEKNCIKKIKNLSNEFLDKIVGTAYLIHKNFIRNNLRHLHDDPEIEYPGDSIDTVVRKYTRRFEVLLRMCKRGSPRSFSATRGEEVRTRVESPVRDDRDEPLLQQYFNAFALLKGGIGKLGDLEMYRDFDNFKSDCRKHAKFLQRWFFGFDAAGRVDRGNSGYITHPEVRKWYANLCCAMFFLKYPNGPMSWFNHIVTTRNLELHTVVNEFRLMGATIEEMKIISDKLLSQFRLIGFEILDPFEYASRTIEPYMIPIPEDA